MMSKSGRRRYIAGVALAFCGIASGELVDAQDSRRSTSIRVGVGRTIVSMHRSPSFTVRYAITAKSGVAATNAKWPHPRPRIAGFSPLIAITTSDARRSPFEESPYEHTVHSGFAGVALNGSPEQNYVIGIADTGAVIDLAAGPAADSLGWIKANLTENTIPIGGVGGVVDAFVTQPIGVFAAGLSAIDGFGGLDVDALVGHSNVSAVASPALDCGTGEVITAVVGTPFLTFFNTVIRVDTPRTVTVGGQTFFSPDVQIQSVFAPIPKITHSIAMEPGGLTPVLTANFFPDFEDLETPLLPTQLSLSPFSIPTGALFFADVRASMGEPGSEAPIIMRMMVDTGAQSSIISFQMAANLNLPLEPDFLVEVCGVGGAVPDVGGYYIDYVKINALGGAIEYSRVPFVVLDLQSPEGDIMDGILGMNFFWNRNVVFEPSLVATSFLSVSDPIPFAFGDNNADRNVDRHDAGAILACMAGPNSITPSPECDHLDADLDLDIDLLDLRRFQLCFSGAGVVADVNCGE